MCLALRPGPLSQEQSAPHRSECRQLCGKAVLSLSLMFELKGSVSTLWLGTRTKDQDNVYLTTGFMIMDKNVFSTSVFNCYYLQK